MTNQFSEIKYEHLLKAIQEIDETVTRKGRQSCTYDLIHDRKLYPPKLVLSIASRFATGKELDPDEFEGGETTPAFKKLRDFGFVIKEKSNATTDPWLDIISKYK